MAEAADASSSVEAFLQSCKDAKLAYGYSLDGEISLVSGYLAIGGRPDGSLLAYRAPLAFGGRRVTHVINCLERPEVPEVDAAFGAAPETLLTLGLKDDGDDLRLRSSLPVAVAWVRAVLRRDPSALIYVHCQSGVNRAPSVALAVLLALSRDEDLSLLAAFARVRHARPSVRPKYIREVALYEQALRGKSSVPALRDGPDSTEFCALYYGLKDDHSESAAARPRQRGARS